MQSFEPNGFIGKQRSGISRFIAPCVFYLSIPLLLQMNQDSEAAASATTKKVTHIEPCC